MMKEDETLPPDLYNSERSAAMDFVLDHKVTSAVCKSRKAPPMFGIVVEMTILSLLLGKADTKHQKVFGHSNVGDQTRNKRLTALPTWKGIQLVHYAET
jgi:hypothetical protein